MLDNFQILKEEYNPETFETTVVINTNYGAFSGSTAADEIDAQYPSQFQGYEIALAKAQRNWAKTMKLICKQNINTLRGIIKQFSNHSKPQPGCHEAVLVRRALEEQQKEYELWTTRIEKLSQYIKNRVVSRDRLVKTYLDKKN